MQRAKDAVLADNRHERARGKIHGNAVERPNSPGRRYSMGRASAQMASASVVIRALPVDPSARERFFKHDGNRMRKMHAGGHGLEDRWHAARRRVQVPDRKLERALAWWIRAEVQPADSRRQRDEDDDGSTGLTLSTRVWITGAAPAEESAEANPLRVLYSAACG